MLHNARPPAFGLPHHPHQAAPYIHITDNIIFSNMSIKPSFLSFIFFPFLYILQWMENGKTHIILCWRIFPHFIVIVVLVYNIMCCTLRMLDMMRYVGVRWRTATTVVAVAGYGCGNPTLILQIAISVLFTRNTCLRVSPFSAAQPPTPMPLNLFRVCVFTIILFNKSFILRN